MLLNYLMQIDWSDLQYNVDDFGRTVYSFPIHIRILFAITLIFILIILILLGIVLTSRIYKTSHAIRREHIRSKYQKILSVLLFDDGTVNEEIKKHFDANDLSDDFNRDIIKDEVIHLHENFTGETAERLEEIYTTINFHLDSLKKLKNKRWYVVAKGMKELALMNVRQALPEISGFINNKNEILRMEARIAIMKLSDKDPLSFLSKETSHLSGWDTANIYSMLSKMPEKLIPDFSTWLSSSNKSVVLFSIQMIGTYRQQESVNSLLELLKSSDEKIRVAAIKALRSLNTIAAERPLIEIYPGEKLYIRLEILKTLESIGNSESVTFLEKILHQPLEDYPLAIQAVRSLIANGSNGKNIVEQLFMQSGAQMQLVINHARDKRL
jgi:hypothetical protein